MTSEQSAAMSAQPSTPASPPAASQGGGDTDEEGSATSGSTGELDAIYITTAKALKDGYSLTSIMQTVIDVARDHRLGGPSAANAIIERLVHPRDPARSRVVRILPARGERSRSRSRREARGDLTKY